MPLFRPIVSREITTNVVNHNKPVRSWKKPVSQPARLVRSLNSCSDGGRPRSVHAGEHGLCAWFAIDGSVLVQDVLSVWNEWHSFEVDINIAQLFGWCRGSCLICIISQPSSREVEGTQFYKLDFFLNVNVHTFTRYAVPWLRRQTALRLLRRRRRRPPPPPPQPVSQWAGLTDCHGGTSIHPVVRRSLARSLARGR